MNMPMWWYRVAARWHAKKAGWYQFRAARRMRFWQMSRRRRLAAMTSAAVLFGAAPAGVVVYAVTAADFGGAPSVANPAPEVLGVSLPSSPAPSPSASFIYTPPPGHVLAADTLAREMLANAGIVIDGYIVGDETSKPVERTEPADEPTTPPTRQPEPVVTPAPTPTDPAEPCRPGRKGKKGCDQAEGGEGNDGNGDGTGDGDEDETGTPTTPGDRDEDETPTTPGGGAGGTPTNPGGGSGVEETAAPAVDDDPANPTATKP